MRVLDGLVNRDQCVCVCVCVGGGGGGGGRNWGSKDSSGGEPLPPLISTY